MTGALAGLRYPLPKQAFNATHTNNFAGAAPGASTETFDSRSDDKGPELEGIAVGRVGDRFYAFIGLERIGRVMIYDVTTPANATFVAYVNPRDFAEPVCTAVNANGSCANATPAPAAGARTRRRTRRRATSAPKGWPSFRRRTARMAGRC